MHGNAMSFSRLAIKLNQPVTEPMSAAIELPTAGIGNDDAREEVVHLLIVAEVEV